MWLSDNPLNPGGNLPNPVFVRYTPYIGEAIYFRFEVENTNNQVYAGPNDDIWYLKYKHTSGINYNQQYGEFLATLDNVTYPANKIYFYNGIPPS